MDLGLLRAAEPTRAGASDCVIVSAKERPSVGSTALLVRHPRELHRIQRCSLLRGLLGEAQQGRGGQGTRSKRKRAERGGGGRPLAKAACLLFHNQCLAHVLDNGVQPLGYTTAGASEAHGERGKRSRPVAGEATSQAETHYERVRGAWSDNGQGEGRLPGGQRRARGRGRAGRGARGGSRSVSPGPRRQVKPCRASQGTVRPTRPAATLVLRGRGRGRGRGRCGASSSSRSPRWPRWSPRSPAGSPCPDVSCGRSWPWG